MPIVEKLPNRMRRMYGYGFPGDDAQDRFGHHDDERKTGCEFVTAIILRNCHRRDGRVGECGFREGTTLKWQWLLAKHSVPSVRERVPLIR